MSHRLAFMDPLVLAIAAGEKDVTRRLTAPRFKPGDVVDVCEALERLDFGEDLVGYRCDGACVYRDGARVSWPWKVRVLPARYCPAWAVRHRLCVVDVRPEFLFAVTDDEARREGIARLWPDTNLGPRETFIAGFQILHKLGLRDDPSLFRIEFKRVET